jgi:predicted PurR-regulated permease PerM
MTALSGLMLFIIFPFIPSMLIGTVFASVAYPLYDRIQKTGNLNPKVLSSVFVIIFTLLILLPMGAVILKGTDSAIGFIQNELKKENRLEAFDGKIFAGSFSLGMIEGVNVSKLAEETVKLVGSFLVNVFEGFIKGMPFVSFSIIIALFTMFFGLSEGSRLVEWISNYSFLSKEQSKKLFQVFQDSCNSVIVTNLIGSFVQSLIIFLAALATGMRQSFLIGFAALMLSFVPILGTAPITIGLAIYSFYSESIGVGITWLVVGAVVGVSDNFVKAWVLKGHSHLHPYLGLLSVIGGLITLGIPGIILGPLIATMFNSMMPILMQARTTNSK